MTFCGPYSGATHVQVIDVDLPITVVVKIVETDPGFKGDTAQGTLLSVFIWYLLIRRSWISNKETPNPYDCLIVVFGVTVCIKMYKSVYLYV